MTAFKPERPLLLVVDDEIPVLKVVERLAAKIGFEVMTCASGAEAMRALLRRPADLAMVDLDREWTIDDALIQSRSKISPWHGRTATALPIHTLVRGRFVMRDRTLQNGARGWGRSVHAIQQMPPAQPRKTESCPKMARTTCQFSRPKTQQQA